MDIKKVSSFNKIGSMKWKLFKKKVWFVVNTFIFLPLLTLLMCVYLQLYIDKLNNKPLSTWYSIWCVVFILSHLLYCYFLLIRVSSQSTKVNSIEWDMDRNDKY